MKVLRNDIDIAVLEDGSGCTVTDPETGQSYEFGTVEHFLLEQIRNHYHPADIINACNTELEAELTEDDFDEFLALLDDWGLLQGGEQFSPHEELPNSEEAIQGGESARILNQQLKQPNRWHLFDPQALFDDINHYLIPVRKSIWLTPIVLTIGFSALMADIDPFLDDLSDAMARYSIVVRMMVVGTIIGLITQIMRGLVARYFGLPTPSLGATLMMGFIPRFNVQIKPEGNISRSVRLWLTSISAITRLLLLSFAILFWSSMRASGSSLVLVSVEVALVAFIGLIFTANPLIPGDGANFISAWRDIPNLHQRSKRALKGFFVRQPAVIIKHSKHRLAFALFGFASICFVVFLVGFLSHRIFTSLESTYHGAGVALFLIILCYLSWNFYNQQKNKKNRRRNQQQSKLHASTTLTASKEDNKRKKRVKLFAWGVLIVVMCLPYHYETGGDADILPTEKATLSFNNSGIIDKIYINSGDWVEPGRKLASLANYRQEKDVAVTASSINSKNYDIEQYLTTPSSENVQLSIADIKSAEMKLHYSNEELKRQQALYKKGIASQEDYEAALKDADLKKADVERAKLSLAALKTQVNPNQIDSLRADVEALKQEEDYYQEELRRTTLLSPIHGRIITEDINFKEKSYIAAGAVLVEIENTKKVSVRIAVPEFDIDEVSLGSDVDLKLWGYPNQTFKGKVDEIEPAAGEQSYGKVIYVRSQIENSDGLLHSGMTGYAKISGHDTITLLAFSRAINRFFAIEVWSWLP